MAIEEWNCAPEGAREASAMPSTHTALHYHAVFGSKRREPWFSAAHCAKVHAYLGGVVRGFARSLQRLEVKMLEHCRVVLVGPMFGGNVGASARAVKNTGLGGMHLVAPIYDDHIEAKKFSHNAEDVLAEAPRHEDLVDAIADCTRVVGFTARQRHRRSFVALRDFARDLSLIHISEPTRLDARSRMPSSA